MTQFTFESLSEGVALVGSALGSAVITLLGILAEYAGIQNIGAGHSVTGVWELVIGIVVLYIGVYLLGYREFGMRLRQRFLELNDNQKSPSHAISK